MSLRNLLVASLVAAVTVASLPAEEAPPPRHNNPEKSEAAVMVVYEDSVGTGVVFKNGPRSFVWTNAHVVESSQKVYGVWDRETGLPKVSVSYRDLMVVKEDFQDGRKVGETSRLAKVVRFGKKDDLAVLWVYATNYGKASAKFAFRVPKLGDDVWHIGSFFGEVGSCSYSAGTIGAVGRLRRGGQPTDFDDPVVYDQVSITAHPGSSGGPVFYKSDNLCAGLLSEFVSRDKVLGPTHGAFCLIPSRRIQEFAKRTGCEWALDDKVAVPDLDKVMKGRVTDDDVPIPPGFPQQQPKN